MMKLQKRLLRIFLQRRKKSIKNYTMQEKPTQQCKSQTNVENEKYVVLDPEKSVTKRRRKRVKGHFEKIKQSISKTELGSITPNKHIIQYNIWL